MNKIEQIANYKISLHTRIYDTFIVNDIMDYIIEKFTDRNIPIMCSNIENNILGFSVSTTDNYIIKECVYEAYHSFFKKISADSSDWILPNEITIEDLYNLTILNAPDKSNVLLVL